MKLQEKIKIFQYILRARFIKPSYPLAIRWNITNLCPLGCIYCKKNKPSDSLLGEELKIKSILRVIDQMATVGVMRISFSGGEPMMRDDIGQIVSHCAKKNIGAEINSSGKFVAERIEEVKDVSLLKLSLDGPEGIHELCKRGISFKEIIKAAEECRKRKIRFSFCTTITKYNVAYLKDILEIASFYNTIVAFQPLHAIPDSPESLEDYFPSSRDFQAAVRMLINEKREGSRHIRNSLPNLKYLSLWPSYKNIPCWSGEVFCMVGPDGILYPCDRVKMNIKLPNCVDIGFAKAYRDLPKIKNCSGCGFCGSTELNLLMAFRFDGVNPIKKYI